MINSPFTAIGRLEGEVKNLERKVDGKAERHELENLKNRVHTLASDIRQIKSDIIYIQEEQRAQTEKAQERSG